MKKILRKIKKFTLRSVVKTQICFKKDKLSLVNKETLMKVMDGHPYIHNDEIKLFSKMATETSGPIVEIGSAFGASPSIFLLNSKPGVKVHSIDPFIVDSMGPFQATKRACENNVKTILKIFGKKNKYSDWTLHNDYSFNVVKNWKEPIQMIFIDGDHNYEAVKKDFEDWYPLVNKGGNILFHDSRKEIGTDEKTFNRGWAGPTKFVNELKNSDKVSLVDEAFSVTVWQKK